MFIRHRASTTDLWKMAHGPKKRSESLHKEIREHGIKCSGSWPTSKDALRNVLINILSFYSDLNTNINIFQNMLSIEQTASSSWKKTNPCILLSKLQWNPRQKKRRLTHIKSHNSTRTETSKTEKNIQLCHKTTSINEPPVGVHNLNFFLFYFSFDFKIKK